ncbi:hypothetical protein [Microvirga roseola]|uniref:hypothetical protein n=1 Tax=Microvirga roseola TaxID=2883126 RepID=UPI001E434888|nr:hypothetical protein [Microvirga roseola]
MIFQRRVSLGLLAVLPLLAGCTQTTNSPPATPAVDPAVVGPRALAALEEVERTRARHREQATNIAVLSFFDPTGISALAKPAMEAEQRRELDEKYKRVEEELRKTIEEAEALKAQNKARSAASKPRKRARAVPAQAEAKVE